MWGQEPHAQRFPLRNQGPQQAQHARNSKSSPQGSLFRSAWRKSPLPPLDQALVVKLVSPVIFDTFVYRKPILVNPA